MARLGRPPKPARERRRRICTIKASRTEEQALRKRAKAAKLPLAAYLRQKGLETA
jgi:hypothetical protein